MFYVYFYTSVKVGGRAFPVTQRQKLGCEVGLAWQGPHTVSCVIWASLSFPTYSAGLTRTTLKGGRSHWRSLTA